jgi:hypothetical protein
MSGKNSGSKLISTNAAAGGVAGESADAGSEGREHLAAAAGGHCRPMLVLAKEVTRGAAAKQG